MLTLTYEYKARPTAQQIQLIEHTLGLCRNVWKFAWRERKDWLNSRSRNVWNFAWRDRKDLLNSRKYPINACSLVSQYIIPGDAPAPNYYQQANALTVAKVL